MIRKPVHDNLDIIYRNSDVIRQEDGSFSYSFGHYINPELQVVAGVDHPVKYKRYGIHESSRRAVTHRARLQANARPDAYPRMIVWPAEGTDDDTIVVFDRSDIVYPNEEFAQGVSDVWNANRQ